MLKDVVTGLIIPITVSKLREGSATLITYKYSVARACVRVAGELVRSPCLIGSLTGGQCPVGPAVQILGVM